MNETVTAAKPALSKMSAFFKGMKSGALNGGLMMGIYQVVMLATGATLGSVGILGIGFLGGGPILATMLTTGLFSGVMAAKRSAAPAAAPAATSVRVGRSAPSLSTGRGLQQQVEMEDEAPARRTDWAERTGRKEQDRVSAILADRANASKDLSL